MISGAILLLIIGHVKMADATHVLLTLDCGVIDDDALRVLAALTESNNVELTGLYVEDEDILKAAQLPGISEVTTLGGVAKLDPDKLRQEVVNQALQARKEFERSVALLKVRSHFQVIRGRTVEKFVDAASDSDLVIINRSRRSAGLRTRQGQHFAPLVRKPKNLLVVNEPWLSGTQVVFLCNAAEEIATSALQTARRIAHAEGIGLTVAVPSGESDCQVLGTERLVVLDQWNEDAVVDLCEQMDARLLVIPPATHLNWRDLLLSLMDRLSCSLLRLV
jgi:hypothetical protein